jgi:hypothetical protein
MAYHCYETFVTNNEIVIKISTITYCLTEQREDLINSVVGDNRSTYILNYKSEVPLHEVRVRIQNSSERQAFFD